MSPRLGQFAVIGCLTLGACGASSTSPPPERVVIDLSGAPANSFTPDQAFGAVIDGLSRHRVSRIYTPQNIAAFQRAGLRTTVYTLRTELGIEAWHWTEEGSWSDPAHGQGYWIGNSHPRNPVMSGWGYRLPRRGDTTDQANDDGYSRIDDGNPATFWKSNPYLDMAYGHGPSRAQWVIVSFRTATPISAAQIDWAAPFARQFEVQYWNGDDPYDDEKQWVTFPQGRVANGAGGNRLQRLSTTPIRTRFVRILLQRSSHSSAVPSRDVRDAMGYAIAEIGLGVIDAHGRFVDAIRHAPDNQHQTSITVSSTDPWHRASDRDPDIEQPGFDRIFRSGLTNGRPMMLTVGALYDTPENTVAQLRFLESRHYPLSEVEIGLEPDGQNVAPEDFADLFNLTARAIHATDPRLTLAGPGLQDATSDTWLQDGADHSWTRRFLRELAARGASRAVGVFTFEHYPYDKLCGPAEHALLAEGATLAAGLKRLREDGLAPNVPRAIIEYGMSAFTTQNNVELPSALFNADVMAHFLTLGGRGGYMLGYGTEDLFDPEHECAGYGEPMLFGQDAKGRLAWPTPAFWGAALVTREWAQPGSGRHLLYRASWKALAAKPAWVVAYPVRRPDGRLAVLLINRDPLHGHSVQLQIKSAARASPVVLPGPFEVLQYGKAQYQWQADGPRGHPTRNDPPRRFPLAASQVSLPPYSLTVVRTVRAH